MKLVPNWKKVARRSWSVHLSWLAALLGAIEVGVQLMATAKPTPYWAAAAALSSLAASLLRLVRQQELHDGD